MSNETKLKNILTANPEVMAVLEAAATLPLPDCWVSAGLIRNRVWDALYGVHSEMNDIDVTYFDATDCSVETEKHWERVLYERFPEHPWSVKNQARMHEKISWHRLLLRLMVSRILQKFQRRLRRESMRVNLKSWHRMA